MIILLSGADLADPARRRQIEQQVAALLAPSPEATGQPARPVEDVDSKGRT